MRLAFGTAFVAALLLAGPSTASASPIVINFEAFTDFDILTPPLTPIVTSMANVTFTNAIALQAFDPAFGSLDEQDFPPHSGVTVVTDFGGLTPSAVVPISIFFSSPLSSVGGYFTFYDGVTIKAFDAGHVLLDSNSLSGNNLLASGNGFPNTPLSVASSLGIWTVEISGGAGAPPKTCFFNCREFTDDPLTGREVYGGSFTLDDLTLDNSRLVPEPSTFVLMLGGAAAAFIGKRRKDARRNSL